MHKTCKECTNRLYRKTCKMLTITNWDEVEKRGYSIPFKYESPTFKPNCPEFNRYNWFYKIIDYLWGLNGNGGLLQERDNDD